MSNSFFRPNSGPSAFGNVHLGHVVIESNKFGDWRRFGADAVGLHVDELSHDHMRFRLDDHECRFLIQRGPREDVVGLGWEVDDHETFDEITARVKDRGVPIDEASEVHAALRGVERMLRFPGPKGIVQEIFTTARTTVAPLRMQNSAFVTGAGGMGHVAITSRKPSAINCYYNTVFDARLTDWIDENISGVKLKIRFLRVNERHHTIAVANTQGLAVDPVRTSVQHVNVQVDTLDDLLSSYQRIKQLGFGMAWAIGQHTNDKELSYYAKTPSGFELEVGWNPIIVTPDLEETWKPSTYQGISIWGHSPVGETVIDKLKQFRLGVTSLFRDEITVPELSGAA